MLLLAQPITCSRMGARTTRRGTPDPASPCDKTSSGQPRRDTVLEVLHSPARYAYALAAAVAVLRVAAVAQAYRPFDGTDADVAEYGVFELELGPVGALQSAGMTTLLAPDMVLNLGVFPRVELVVQSTGFIALVAPVGSPRWQAGDAGVFVKTVLHAGALQEKTGPSVALEAGPLWSTLIPEASLGGSAALIVSMRFDAITVHLNQEARLGIVAGRVPGSQTRAWLQETDVIVEGPVAWRIRPVTEGLIDYSFGQFELASALVGALWRLDEFWTLDVGLRCGWEHGDWQSEARAGLTWSLEVWD